MNNGTYTYSILQYIHSQAIGEVVNIGLLCIFPSHGKVVFRHAESLSRPKTLYPAFPESLVKSYLKAFLQKSTDINQQWPLFGNALSRNGAATFIQEEFLYKDDSALQFSEPRTGVLYAEESKVVDALYEQYLGRFHHKTTLPIRHNETYILRSYRKLLQAKDEEITKYLKTNYAITEKASLKFEIAWQNKSLHLVKPLSFDLSTAQEIQVKSAAYLGYLTALEEAARKQNYTFDFLVTSPQLPQPDLKKAYQNALDMLRISNTPKEIIEEKDLERYTEKTIAEIVRK
ncbi:MAG: DUF3037 domain-containing protein [Cytophagales bacterium]|jgi:hypothetical protein|nr:DUF3037 domain-containing protein [Cytophagales bacterium]